MKKSLWTDSVELPEFNSLNKDTKTDVLIMGADDEKIDFIIETDYRPIPFDIENSVNTLKELAEQRRCSTPEYEYANPEELGYDKDGNPKWCCTCRIINDKTGIIRQVWASSKKGAKKAAAYLVLCEHFNLQNQYGINRECNVWKYKNGKLMPEPMMKD